MDVQRVEHTTWLTTKIQNTIWLTSNHKASKSLVTSNKASNCLSFLIKTYFFINISQTILKDDVQTFWLRLWEPCRHTTLSFFLDEEFYWRGKGPATICLKLTRALISFCPTICSSSLLSNLLLSNHMFLFTPKQLWSLNSYSGKVVVNNELGCSSRWRWWGGSLSCIAPLIHEKGLKQHRVRQSLPNCDRWVVPDVKKVVVVDCGARATRVVCRCESGIWIATIRGVARQGAGYDGGTGGSCVVAARSTVGGDMASAVTMPAPCRIPTGSYLVIVIPPS
jgi:hypothetical protein